MLQLSQWPVASGQWPEGEGSLTVVAAVIKDSRGVLICQRKRGARHALKWEFPGGKVEPGEDLRDALARELREELGIGACIGAQMHFQEVRYGAEPPIHLHFFEVTEFRGEPHNLEFEKIAWEAAENLLGYDFVDGDYDFVRKLATDH